MVVGASKYNLPAPVTVTDFYLCSILLELEQLNANLAQILSHLNPTQGEATVTPAAGMDVIDLREPKKRKVSN